MYITKNTRIEIKFLLILSFIVYSLFIPEKSLGQLCTGSLCDPLVDLTFGAGFATHAGALPAGSLTITR